MPCQDIVRNHFEKRMDEVGIGLVDEEANDITVIDKIGIEV